MSIESAPDEKPSPRADLYSAAVWLVLGAAIVIGSWTMDRLEQQGATLYTAPGLVPGMLGLVILALGVLLGLRAVRQGALGAQAAANIDRESWRRTGLVLVLFLVYAVGLIGRTPFWLATFLFVSLFVIVFEYPMRRERHQLARGVLMAAVYGAATSLVVSGAFQEIFLVRLP